MSNLGYNPKIDAYLEKTEPFAKPIFIHIRTLLHSICPEIVEEMKWGIPHFDYHGEMMCIFAAYKKHCSFSFWKDSLMSDARLQANSHLPAINRFMGKLTSIKNLPEDTELVDWIREAMALNEQGVKLPPRKSEGAPKMIEVHEAFSAALSSNPHAKLIFESKSPSFRKDYNSWIGEAKTDATRNKRIEAAIEWIADGKSRFWKYSKSG
ncbi:YdeI/OmpD-associated family protein [Phyllobacterium sp. YR531]|uniref:YdeI/OmpD-associated family protein n=1 Tax=Phyllobacterium sp. YR531 TaxID=1144343 RepID=UPI00026F7591|nr:YdeI/OmpD-associated family protein [Phyllobacterium sp. YR531]EJN02077.1 hypothetical protein PMI41_02827 [Phyllobacterium sp. YR531]